MLSRTRHGTLTPLFFFSKKHKRNKACLIFLHLQPYSHPFLSYDDLTRFLIQRGMRGDFRIIRKSLQIQLVPP